MTMLETIDNILVKQSVVDAETQDTVPAPESVVGRAFQSAQSASWTTNGMPD
jgi:hypothetical protein